MKPCSALSKTMHPEDIKAVLRKRHGSVRAFIRARSLPATGVADFFRGRTSRRVADAIERELQEQFSESNRLDLSSSKVTLHRLSVEAR